MGLRTRARRLAHKVEDKLHIHHSSDDDEDDQTVGSHQSFQSPLKIRERGRRLAHKIHDKIHGDSDEDSKNEDFKEKASEGASDSLREENDDDDSDGSGSEPRRFGVRARSKRAARKIKPKEFGYEYKKSIDYTSSSSFDNVDDDSATKSFTTRSVGMKQRVVDSFHEFYASPTALQVYGVILLAIALRRPLLLHGVSIILILKIYDVTFRFDTIKEIYRLIKRLIQWMYRQLF